MSINSYNSYNSYIKNVIMRVEDGDVQQIQKIVFDNDGCWKQKTKNINWIIIDINGDMSWAKDDNSIVVYSQIKVQDWIDDYNSKFPVYKMYINKKFIVRFDGPLKGEVVWTDENSLRKVGDKSDDWLLYNGPNWSDVDISEYINDEAETEEYITTVELETGSIVLAKNIDGSEVQGKYFGYYNGKHLVQIDFSTNVVLLTDEVQHLESISKDEAKEKIKKMFATADVVQKICNMIDLIK